jgi:hypothetical protein
LVGVLYILDEPSIGLHARDNDRLINTLKSRFATLATPLLSSNTMKTRCGLLTKSSTSAQARVSTVDKLWRWVHRPR